jgi:DNA-directed RNA polymerase subunit E"
MPERACRLDKRLTKTNVCPNDKSADLTRNWKGIVMVMDPANSTIAKEAGITVPGKYAVRIK